MKTHMIVLHDLLEGMDLSDLEAVAELVAVRIRIHQSQQVQKSNEPETLTSNLPVFIDRVSRRIDQSLAKVPVPDYADEPVSASKFVSLAQVQAVPDYVKAIRVLARLYGYPIELYEGVSGTFDGRGSGLRQDARVHIQFKEGAVKPDGMTILKEMGY